MLIMASKLSKTLHPIQLSSQQNWSSHKCGSRATYRPVVIPYCQLRIKQNQCPFKDLSTTAYCFPGFNNNAPLKLTFYIPYVTRIDGGNASLQGPAASDQLG